MADPAVTIDEGVVLAAGGQAEQRIAVATQWQLMWWRFRKHRLALGGTFVLVLFYLVSLFADFFAYTDPNESDAQRSLIAPQQIHWRDDGSFRPYVHALKGARDPLTFKRVYVPDPGRKVYLSFFASGEPYQFLGFIPMDRHLIGVQEGRAGDSLFLLGTEGYIELRKYIDIDGRPGADHGRALEYLTPGDGSVEKVGFGPIISRTHDCSPFCLGFARPRDPGRTTVFRGTAIGSFRSGIREVRTTPACNEITVCVRSGIRRHRSA